MSSTSLELCVWESFCSTSVSFCSATLDFLPFSIHDSIFTTDFTIEGIEEFTPPWLIGVLAGELSGLSILESSIEAGSVLESSIEASPTPGCQENRLFN